MLPLIEEEMKACLSLVRGEGMDVLREMLAYHLGWEGQGAGEQARGKRVRPLLVLLTTAAAGGDWRQALPAGAAVELVHNFSLIHDDIQDKSVLRRGRKTLWTLWDIPLAINAGDSMFALAHVALQRMEQLVTPDIALKAWRILPQACLVLTQGQYLDLSYERRNDLSVEDYWPMIMGKTAALIAACTELGAAIAGAVEEQQEHYRIFGEKIGLAFQAYDDLLGIWGNESATGKSASSDLASGKKSLPVLYGLQQNGAFAAQWNGNAITQDQIPVLAELLEKEGAKEFTQRTASRLTMEALQSVEEARPSNLEAYQALDQFARTLVAREA